MDSKKLSYTQIPNIFFDTCQLHETAQILFLRLYRHLYNPFEQTSERFTGSIRKLCNLVKMSKSTVHRGLKELETSRLIAVHREKGNETDREVMVITVNSQELWALNAVSAAGYTVPIWDKELPVPTDICPDLGQTVPEEDTNATNLGQDDSNLGQTVPDSSSKSDTITTNTSHTEIPNDISSIPLPSKYSRAIGQIAFRRSGDVQQGIEIVKEIHTWAREQGMSEADFSFHFDQTEQEVKTVKNRELQEQGYEDHLHYFCIQLENKVTTDLKQLIEQPAEVEQA